MNEESASSQAILERLMVNRRLQNFDPENNDATDMLMQKFGYIPSQHQLLALAQVISQKLSIHLDREAYRRKNVLIKWYAENVDKIRPFLNENIVIETEE